MFAMRCHFINPAKAVRILSGCVWSHWTKCWKQSFPFFNCNLQRLWKLLLSPWMTCSPRNEEPLQQVFPNFDLIDRLQTDVLNNYCSFERRVKCKEMTTWVCYNLTQPLQSCQLYWRRPMFAISHTKQANNLKQWRCVSLRNHK